jgi:predicted transcriptional regulator
MSKNTTIKVSKKTLEKLHKLAGEMAAIMGKRVTLEEAINKLLKENNKENDEDLTTIEDDRKSFLAILDQKISGAQPEDFKEYHYEDLGNI